MHNDKEIREKAFEQLKNFSDSELQKINDLAIEVHVQNPEGKIERYTVFLERGLVDGKEGWIVRNIISPDELQNPKNKADGKIE